ncbi:MAG: AmmeMemoRadiSam system protein A, partial [Elusimicrobia bacterium]|nr:AmmeMemoRadiSam system protein A [Elusimicrobiota bacterium]
VPINTDLAKHLIHLSPLIENNLKPYKGEHSIEVQIPFLQKVLKKFTLVPLLLNTQYPDISQAVGKAISEIAKTPGVLILISTDLSHYPDKDTANLVDSSSLKALPPSIEDPLYFWLTNRILLRRGGPKLGTTYCGEAALLTALFAFKELEANQTVLVSYTNSGMLENGDPNKAVGYATALWTKNKSFISDPHPLTFTQKQTLLKLARQSIEDFLKKPPRAPNPDSPAEQAEIKQTWSPEPKLWEDIDFNLPANVFVTLKKRGASPGQDLRGCVGSTQPQLPLAEAVQRFAVASAVEDHRFQPVTLEELPNLKIEISKLSFYQQAKSPETIQPTKHGVLLFQGDKSGLFLPQVWEQIPDKSNFLSELCSQKANLPRDCWKNSQTHLLTFTVEEFSE